MASFSPSLPPASTASVGLEPSDEAPPPSIVGLPVEEANKICAGQVIQGLSDAVKELLENSLDSGANAVEIRLVDSGAEEILVSDNGSGVSPKDYRSLCLKSTTSKISSFDDVATVSSFGFRGEALAALCEVSNSVTVITRTANEPAGSELQFNRAGQLVKGPSLVSRPVGTTVIVRGLFGPLPVRQREFLKSIKRHYAKALALIQAYAIVVGGQIRLVVSTIPATIRGSTGGQSSSGVKDSLQPKQLQAAWSPSGQPAAPFSTPSPPQHHVQRQAVLTTTGRVSAGPSATSSLSSSVLSSSAAAVPAAYGTTLGGLKGSIVDVFGLRFAESLQPLEFSFEFSLPSLRGSNEDGGLGAQNSCQEGGEEDEESADAVTQQLAPSVAAEDSNAQKRRSAGGHKVSFTKQQASVVGYVSRSVSSSGSSGVGTGSGAGGHGGGGIGRSTSDRQYLSINGRPVETPSRLSKAINEVWRTFELSHKPAYVLDLRLPGGSFDINLRPDKREAALAAGLEESLAASLKDKLFQLWDNGKARSFKEAPLMLSSLDAFAAPAPLTASSAPASTSSANAPLGAKAAGSLQKQQQQEHRNQCSISGFSGGTASRQIMGSLQQYSSSVSLEGSRAMALEENRVQDAGKQPFISAAALDGSGIRAFPFSPQGNSIGKGGASSAVADDDARQSPCRCGVGCSGHGEGNEGGQSPRAHANDGEDCYEEKLFLPLAGSKRKRGVKNGSKNDALSSAPDDQVGTDAYQVDLSTMAAFSRAKASCLKESSVHAGRRLFSVDLQFQLLQEAGDLAEVFIFHGLDAALRAYDRSATEEETVPQASRSNNVEAVVGIGSAEAVSGATSDGSVASLAALKSSPSSASASSSSSSGPSSEAGETLLSKTLHQEQFLELSERISGQFNNGFIVAGTAAGDLFIIDQHASDEKRTYERLMRTTVIHEQRLLVPRPIDLTAGEEAIVVEHLELFNRNGFHFALPLVDPSQPLGRRMRLSAVPFSKNITFKDEDVRDLASAITDAGISTASASSSPSFRPAASVPVVRIPKIASMLASRACRSSVMIGTSLAFNKMRRIVSGLCTLKAPWNCPHGRPTLRHLVDLRKLPVTLSSPGPTFAVDAGGILAAEAAATGVEEAAV